MIDLKKYFTEDKTTYAKQGIVLYQFDVSKTEEFIQDMLGPIRDAYISEERIKQIEKKHNKTRQEIIEKRLPHEASIKSGDFGEILTYHIARQYFASSANVTPMKWRFKDDKQKASPKTDILLFYKPDATSATAADTMYSIEVKARSKKPSKDSSIFNAVKGADVDRTSRAVETIDYLLTRIEETNDQEEFYDSIDRFGGAYPKPYNKKFYAVAVVESKYLPKHVHNIPASMSAAYSGIDIYCLPIRDLYAIFQKIYAQLPTKA